MQLVRSSGMSSKGRPGEHLLVGGGTLSQRQESDGPKGKLGIAEKLAPGQKRMPKK